MARSPMEIMIDRACGLPDDWESRPRVPQLLLRCPKCKCEKFTKRESSDPLGAMVIEYTCPKCGNPDDAEPYYFDSSGAAIVAEGT